MHKLVKQGSVVLASALVFMSMLGLVWSIIPILGNTLPHHLEAGAGIPFQLAAFLVSIALGLLVVAAMALFGLVQTAEVGPDENG
jgi:hypothetical protein